MNNKFYLFLDESGDLGSGGTSHFIIAVVATQHPEKLSKCAKEVRRRVIGKKIKKCAELKASSSNDTVRKRMLTLFSKTPSEVYYLMIPKCKIYDRLHKVRDRLYNFLTGLLVEILPYKYKNVHLIVDKRTTNKVLCADFTNYVNTRLLTHFPEASVEVSQRFSNATQELQVVDFVAWSLFPLRTIQPRWLISFRKR